eukprot:8967469-Pyramimonas_sp.AAC.1
MHGAALSVVQGIFGERHKLALAANSETMIDGVWITLLDIGSSMHIVGLKTAQAVERSSRSHSHDIIQLDLTKRLCVSGVGNGAAVCD